MKFPNYLQPDRADCGPTCLRIVAKHYGRQFSLITLRDMMFKNRSGVSLLSISDAAEKIGFRTQGSIVTFDSLKNLDMPVIAHWAQNHFVVIYRITGETIFISDPAIGLIQYSKHEFLSRWHSTVINEQPAGIILSISPTPVFYENENEKEKKLNLTYLIGYLKPYHKFIFHLLLSFLVASLLSLIFPFLTQSIVDVGIGTNNLDFVLLVLIAQLALTIGQTATDLIRSWLMLYLTSRISISLVSDFLIKLMKLPIRFFDGKVVGDIVQRITDNSRVQNFLTGNLINMSFSIFIFVIYSTILAYYNWGILLVFYAGSFLYILWILLFLKKRKELDYKQFSQASSNQSNMYELITGMQEIKLNNVEKQKRWGWERIQAKIFQLNIKALALQQNQQVGSFFLNQSKNIIISFLTVKAVIHGEITLGMMVSIQYILGQLNTPINEAVGFIRSAQDANISLERLGEIHFKEDEEKAETNRITELGVHKDIYFDNVSFQYEGSRSAKILDSVTLHIPRNKMTAIVGQSGSGKTTLLKLMLGFYEPSEGRIRIGDFNFADYNVEEWRKRCGVVMQDGFIFSDTILNNIVLGDEIMNKERLQESMRIANIMEFVEKLPLKFNTKIGGEGVALSAGQKQRLLIARSIYKDPEYLFFDEATNSLDTNNEKIIIENINGYKQDKTLVVVAHRLSTVKNADQIVVLNNGKIAEIGKHQDLIDKKGYYYQLIENQLDLR